VIYFLFFFFLFLIWLWAFLIIKKTEKKFIDSFKSLSFDVLERSNRSFFDLASNYFEKHKEGAKGEFKESQRSIESILDPLKESLKKIQEQNNEIEKQRSTAYSLLFEQVSALKESEYLLRSETANLAKALKSPNIRGSWGQIHLRRVVELAGMLDNCDFFEQKTVVSEEKIYRPDLIVKLPGNRQIIVDAKTPLDAYLESVEENDDKIRKEKLASHAKHLKNHIKDLSSKEYWKHFSFSPEYVILFLPAEAFFSAALVEDPTLLELGAKENIVIATPTTLIAILRAIAYSWKQESFSKNTKEIMKLGVELYERLDIMGSHWQKLGKNLSLAVDSYNQAISSLESRVLVSARKLKEISLSSNEADHKELLQQITKTTRTTGCKK
jgi:DNA recombination protein RmuC